ncbi:MULTISPECIES: hypothetical protein [Bacillaceae]|nr:hypothetical protein [Bacillus sp. PK3_68]
MANNDHNHLNEKERKKQEEQQQENEFRNQARYPDQQNRLKDQENMRK